MRLFQACFPQSSKFTKEYLTWLYVENPAGPAIGVNAYSGNRLAAHYAVIPAYLERGGDTVLGCWSLNTATHPDFQGRGLFLKLAEMTYDLAKRNGCSCVIGVANSNSTHGFVSKLRFHHIGKIAVSLGYGMVEQQALKDALHRSWTPASLAWRLKNPSRTYFVARKSSYASIYTCVGPGRTPVLLGSGRNNVNAIEQLPELRFTSAAQPRFVVGFGLRTNGIQLPIPTMLLPSPWNVIYRRLDPHSHTSDSLAVQGLDLDTF